MDNAKLFQYIGDVWKNCGASAGQEEALSSAQSLQTVLQSNYQTDFAQNQALMNNLNLGLTPITAAGVGQQGFTAPELAAMNSQALNSAAASNQKLQTAIGEGAAGKNTATPGVESGVLQAEKATAQTAVDTGLSNTQANITQQNYATGRQNYWNAVKATSEEPAAFENPTTSAGNAATGGQEAVSSQANANEAANNSWQGLATGLMSAAGAAACWIAAKTFGGWDDPRTAIVRNYLFGEFRESRLGEWLTDLYTEYGERLSRSRVAMFFLKPIFRLILWKAKR